MTEIAFIIFVIFASTFVWTHPPAPATSHKNCKELQYLDKEAYNDFKNYSSLFESEGLGKLEDYFGKVRCRRTTTRKPETTTKTTENPTTTTTTTPNILSPHFLQLQNQQQRQPLAVQQRRQLLSLQLQQLIEDSKN
uniref:Uncharacterized protein n=1 Tax=Megaselia scalaris TaxID=36166 RepID=T1GBG2_MEGSC